MTFKTYSEALAYFYSYTNFNPANFDPSGGLERLRELLSQIGDPHKKFPSLLIAGTKGKGSTAAISESILREAGYKSGLYTSPHLHSFRERIRIAGELISEELLISLGNRLKPYFEDTPGLSAFELITVLAFSAFAESNIDIAVLEVGLGGRLDATNAVDPAVAVITSISYDHTQILGDTLTLIAREKAGIIRPGALVISAPQFDEAMQMIEQVCDEQNAQLEVVERDWKWQHSPSNLTGETFILNGETYQLPLLGQHQIVNAVTAIAAVTGFGRRTGFEIPVDAIHAGVAKVAWLGRMEILNQEPLVMIDSAMNGDSCEKLVEALQHYFPERKITFIYGASSDHPIGDMLEVLLPVAHRMVMVSANHPRAAKSDDLVVQARDLGYETTSAVNADTALETALSSIGSDSEIICVAGSLFLAADLREAWLRRNNLPLPPIDPLVLS